MAIKQNKDYIYTSMIVCHYLNMVAIKSKEIFGIIRRSVEVTVGLSYLIIIILIVLPIALFILFSLKFEAEHDLGYYYLGEALIVLLITAVGHYYYYIHYDLDVFPSKDYIMFFLGIPLLGLIVVYFFNFIFRRLKKESGLSFKGWAILFICLVIIFNWLIPLGHKYYYVKRLDLLEEIFATRDTNKVTTDGDIMIGLVESAYDPLMRTRYRSPSTYDNYFYIKNNGNTPYTGDIYLALYNENNNAFEMKLLQDVEVATKSVQLLIERENKITSDEWSQRSFGTKQKVKTFEAIISKR